MASNLIFGVLVDPARDVRSLLDLITQVRIQCFKKVGGGATGKKGAGTLSPKKRGGGLHTKSFFKLTRTVMKGGLMSAPLPPLDLPIGLSESPGDSLLLIQRVCNNLLHVGLYSGLCI